MPVTAPTYIGQVASVATGVVRVRLRDDMPSTLIMIDGDSYRVGQIGAFVRIPLGYTQLYATCTQVGADAAPPIPASSRSDVVIEQDDYARLVGYRWMTVVLFGESLAGHFERGVGQYPTVGDEVHIVTTEDLKTIYGNTGATPGATVTVGRIASAVGIPANLDMARLISRHCAVVGSTGAGKSNLVTVLLESLTDGTFPNARAILIDPHGEYATALGDRAHVFSVAPNEDSGERHLEIPFWALPFSELQQLVFGGLQPQHEAAIRDLVLEMKADAAKMLLSSTDHETLTADSPVPFSIKKLWYDLDRFERVTFPKPGNQQPGTEYPPTDPGDPVALRPAQFPQAGLPQNLWAERRTGSPSSDPQRARVLARPRCVGLTAWTPAPRTRARPLVVLLERGVGGLRPVRGAPG